MSDLLRMTGMYSGMDTESIIASLVSAKQVKVDNLKGEQTKLEWKQEAWQDLNKKIYSLFSSTLSKLRLTGAYKKKTTTSSDTTKATVLSSDSAVDGTHSLQIKKTAKSGYLTGSQLKTNKTRTEVVRDKDGKAVMEDAVDADGNLIYDKNGNVVKREVTKEVPVPYTTSDALSLLDSGIMGNTLTVTVGKGDDAVVTEIELKNEKDDNGEEIPMTINNLLAKLRDAGVNATFDEENQRFFISSKQSGAAGEFTITDSSTSNRTLKALGLDTNSYLNTSVLTSGNAVKVSGSQKISDFAPGLVNSTLNVTVGGVKRKYTVNGVETEYLSGGKVKTIDIDGNMTLDDLAEKMKELGVDCEFSEADQRFVFSTDTNFAIKVAGQSNADSSTLLEGIGLSSLRNDGDALLGSMIKNPGSTDVTTGITKLSNLTGYAGLASLGITGGAGKIEIKFDGTGEKTTIDFDGTMSLDDLAKKFREAGVNCEFNNQDRKFIISGNQEFSMTVKDSSGNALSDTDSVAALGVLGLGSEFKKNDDCSKIAGEDAEIVLNGAKYTSSSNAFTINGLSFNVINPTAEDETISLVTNTDYNGIYDTIKDFFAEYNDLINEMDKLYNADSARKYSMLTDDERAAMTEAQAEKWDDTIKASLLRKDNTLSKVMNSMINIMMGGFYTKNLSEEQKKNMTEAEISAWYNINGNKKYLSDFGIKTLSYFNAQDNEHHAYHIDGDPDDDSTSTNEDKLKKAITEDPEGTAEFFAALCKSLYESLDKLMARTNYSSMYKVYNDKQMQSDYDSYTKKIKDAEEKLNDYEDKWYNKFSAMEVALSKLQSNTSAITSMLGS